VIPLVFRATGSQSRHRIRRAPTFGDNTERRVSIALPRVMPVGRPPERRAAEAHARPLANDAW
jgi:hypothetical protein